MRGNGFDDGKRRRGGGAAGASPAPGQPGHPSVVSCPTKRRDNSVKAVLTSLLFRVKSWRYG